MEHELFELKTLLLTVLDNQGLIMTQIADLTAALATLQNDTSTALTDISAQVANLKAQIAALSGTTPTDTDLQPLIDQVNAIDASIKAADPGTTPTPAPATGVIPTTGTSTATST